MLYDFIGLKELVEREFGIDTDKTTSTFRPITQKFQSLADVDKKVTFNSEGIFIDKRKGFLYIESGYSKNIINQAKTSVPKFHIVNCETIQSQKNKQNFNGYYVFSNEIIEMEDRYDGVTKELTVCGYCIKRHVGVYKGMKTSEFREKFILKGDGEGNFYESELPKGVSTDFWGYTAGWDETSKNYRSNKKFTCEKCGIQLNQNLVNGYYLETHHIDGNKKNNAESNLKCLCVLCHANFDDLHRDNYSRGSGRQKLRDFINLFEDELIRVGNPYLRLYKK